MLVAANMSIFPLESLVLRMETEALMEIHPMAEALVNPGILRRHVRTHIFLCFTLMFVAYAERRM